jgi:hypothetical protein
VDLLLKGSALTFHVAKSRILRRRVA